MAYSVYATENFERETEKLSTEQQEKIRKLFLQLKENPYAGNRLRYPFFREKRIREKRVYFLVYDDLQAVLFVAVSDKKTQQETIDYVIKYLPEFRKYLIDKIMED